MKRTPEPEVMSDDAEARAYQAADFGDVDAPYVERLLKLIHRWHRRPHLCILDLGTGPADIPVRITRQLSNARIIALDASAAMLALGRPKMNQQLSLIRGDAKHLPFADTSFDAIISNSLLHHLLDPVPFWKEIRRVAIPKAIILVQDLFRPPSRPVALSLVAKHAGHESKLLQQLFFQSLLAAFRPAEVRAQLRAAKLSRLRVSTIDDRHVVVEGRT